MALSKYSTLIKYECKFELNKLSPIVKYKAYNVSGKKILSTVDKIQIFLSQFWRKSILSLGFLIRLPSKKHNLKSCFQIKF